MKREESFFTFDYEIVKENHEILFKQDQSILVTYEAKRLSEKYGKDTFDCEDLQRILCIGRNCVRRLLSSKDFPSITVGSRKFVSAISLAAWLNRG